ncbi:hypothetical protein [Aureimonas sp. AU4]|uniref:hypothetical protein n=1 Tax=Aureimonas sp. AU4 TaxID=1638163 RepID=UPI0012E371F2|nr:hypothetical protein [Aureimonas sp. AU4]
MRALVRRPAGAKLRALMLRRLRERLAREAELRLDGASSGGGKPFEGEEKLTDRLDARA